jgi:hypothetical protein
MKTVGSIRSFETRLDVQKRELSDIHEALMSPVLTPHNPLGLYDHHVLLRNNDGAVFPLPYALPYEQPDLNQEYMFIFGESVYPEADMAAYLTLGGICEYFLRRDPNDTDKINMLESMRSTAYLFGIYLSFRINAFIAHTLLNSEGYSPDSTEELARDVDRHKELIPMYIASLRKNDAMKVEESLGLIAEGNCTSSGLRGPAATKIEVSGKTMGITVEGMVHTPTKPRCAAAHVINSEGLSLLDTMWSRANHVSAGLPWLFKAQLDKAKLPSKTE